MSAYSYVLCLNALIPVALLRKITPARAVLCKVHDNICKFAKNGLAPSEIGVILRDSHGIAQVNSLTGSKILRILKLATEMLEDLYHLIKKAVAIRKLYNVFTAMRAFRIVSPSEGLPP
ncbi:40S ribosomal protein S13 [Tanacetum coccineum]